ncbi:ATP-binding protein [Streptomyces sp. NBC_01795]|uniref:ATP-binding protein n=1 Tax=unclassified Streptomyces TaxID=2593676 RepID=UPI002DD8143D|nr:MULTISPECIES: ATP-binding protein [unclassified Streptomyces]WSA92182.1 ATP-binding protein [Streptomyces sp. NBC_01795]WSB76548.1 ATP-binding protein [Streptomyces sp. NBC_01775]
MSQHDQLREPYEASCRLPRGRQSVARARALVRAVLTAWEVDAGVTEDAELVVSELVTNAVRAPAPSDRQVAVRVVRPDEAAVRLEVGDAGEGRPAPRVPAPGDEGGYGLLLVEALAYQWGTERRPGGVGKTVWAELRAPAHDGEVTASAVTVCAGHHVHARGAWHTVRGVRGERFATGALAIVLTLDEGPALRVPATEKLTVRRAVRG